MYSNIKALHTKAPEGIKRLNRERDSDPTGYIKYQEPLEAFTMFTQKDQMVKTSSFFLQRLINTVCFLAQIYKIQIRVCLKSPNPPSRDNIWGEIPWNSDDFDKRPNSGFGLFSWIQTLHVIEFA